ncbi:MAG: transposase [Clostridiales bacterium]|nr:transposase [Clostridiales bacterium]
MFKPSGDLRRDYDRLSDEYMKQKDRILSYQEQIVSFRHSNKTLENALAKEKEHHKEDIAQRDAIIQALKIKVAHLEALANRDGTNTGIPTSQTPINQKKVIPNSRRNTGRKKGGQLGHEKNILEAFDESEVDENVLHELDTESETCDICGGDLVFTGDYVEKDEFDVIIKTVKRRHKYAVYECRDCGAITRLQIEKHLKQQNQYGSNVQALSLSLMVTGNMAMNKVRMFLSGISGGELHPSEGYICKLYKRAANCLVVFMADLKRFMIQRTLLYWDDTVIMILTQRACMRFYGDEKISYYTAHESKDLDGIIEDNVLDLLTEETTVMHDHNTVNYNERFCFQNIECLQHLERDLQKSADDNPEHTWAKNIKETISLWIKKRKDYQLEGKIRFEESEEEKFHARIHKEMKRGHKESSKSTNPTTVPSEITLLNRLEKYYDNYFRWVSEFALPTTDNLSERGLRGIKSHMKISGQFESVAAAKNYATVKTYVETCRKNGINEMMALSRLCSGNPYTVDEIFT